MAWKCADCGTVETDEPETSISAVCHHCGKPLCVKDQTRLADDAFHTPPRTGLPDAVHCDGCRQAHHSRAVVIGVSRR